MRAAEAAAALLTAAQAAAAACGWAKTHPGEWCENRIHIGNASTDAECEANITASSRCAPGWMQRDHWSQYCGCVPAGATCELKGGDSDVWTCAAPTPPPPPPTPMPPAPPLPPASTVTAVMQQVAGYWLSHASDKQKAGCGWEHGAFMQGTMAALDATGNQSYLDYAMWWGERNGWITCNYPKVLTEHAAANDMSCGQTFAEVYLRTGSRNDTYIRSIRDDVLSVLVNRSQIDDWWWVDAYFMAMGTFARIGSITGDVRFHDKNYALYNDSAVRRGLWSAEAGLYFRDESYQPKLTPSGEHVFWGRGNGWAAGALARTMEFTPASHPSYPVYAAHLNSMAETLKRMQSSDGMWRASLLDPAQVPNPETTGTSGVLIGLAWGVNNGVLDRATYLPVIDAAWHGLNALAVQSSGLLGYCQPVGGGPNPATPTSTSDFCVGLFLLAAAEVAKLAK